jgi:quaternary ammonium compound-resistance protein SugE
MGSAYAVWTGIGAVGIAIVGMVWWSEPATLLHVGCIALILIGIAGLKLTGSEIDIT